MSDYTEEDRELAAEICAIAASNDEFQANYDSVAEQLEISDDCPAMDLALYAWAEAMRQYDQGVAEICTCDAEAECMIRTGWSPAPEDL